MSSRFDSNLDFVVFELLELTIKLFQEKTNHLINQLNSQVKTLPPADEKEGSFSLKIENLLDVDRRERSQQSGTVRSAITFANDQSM